MAFIEVSCVSKTLTTNRGVRHVLNDVTLSVDQGEFVSIVGFMGCGKSTLLSIIAGLTLPDAGEVRQRVAIAGALATEPDVLFLDDPFGALDALTRANLQQELAQLCSAEKRPVTTIMITNSVEEALLL